MQISLTTVKTKRISLCANSVINYVRNYCVQLQWGIELLCSVSRENGLCFFWGTNLHRMGWAEVEHRTGSIRIDPGWPMCCYHFGVESMPLVAARLKRRNRAVFILHLRRSIFFCLTQRWWAIVIRDAVGQRSADPIAILMDGVYSIRGDCICGEQLLTDCRFWRFETEERGIDRLLIIRNGIIFVGTWIEITVRIRIEQKTFQFGANAWLQRVQRRANLILNVSRWHNRCEMLVRRFNQQLIVVIWWWNINTCNEWIASRYKINAHTRILIGSRVPKSGVLLPLILAICASMPFSCCGNSSMSRNPCRNRMRSISDLATCSVKSFIRWR